jgi:hypothetical protein
VHCISQYLVSILILRKNKINKRKNKEKRLKRIFNTNFIISKSCLDVITILTNISKLIFYLYISLFSLFSSILSLLSLFSSFLSSFLSSLLSLLTSLLSLFSLSFSLFLFSFFFFSTLFLSLSSLFFLSFLFLWSLYPSHSLQA